MSKELRKPTLFESIALGGVSCVFTVNFTHPIVRVWKAKTVHFSRLTFTSSSH
jgi:hypothetical protein